ncbi:putative microtubule binding protein 2C [Dioscorea sansibarensis]
MPENHRGYADPPDHHNSSSSSPTQPPSFSDTAPANSGNVDRVLFKNLVEMVPLVESLMDRRASSSYSRRASMVYTPAPSQSRKIQGSELRGRKTGQIGSARKRRDNGDNEEDYDGFSAISSKEAEKDRDEVIKLLQNVNELQKKLSEKEEALKSAEDLLNQMSTAYASLEDLRSQVAEKDSLVKSSNLELYNVKIRLAEKQAAMEKLVWETKMSNRKIEELEGNLTSKDLEVNALMQLLEEIAEKGSAGYPDYNTTYSDPFNQYPVQTDDDDEIQMSEMEEARTAYINAVSIAKMNPCDKTLAAAAEARFRLQAFVL